MKGQYLVCQINSCLSHVSCFMFHGTVWEISFFQLLQATAKPPELLNVPCPHLNLFSRPSLISQRCMPQTFHIVSGRCKDPFAGIDQYKAARQCADILDVAWFESFLGDIAAAAGDLRKYHLLVHGPLLVIHHQGCTSPALGF